MTSRANAVSLYGQKISICDNQCCPTFRLQNLHQKLEPYSKKDRISRQSEPDKWYIPSCVRLKHKKHTVDWQPMLTAAALYRCKTDMCMHILHLPVSTPLWMSCHNSHSIKTASKCIQRITHDSINVVDVFTFMKCNCPMNRGNVETKTLIQILYKIQPNNNTKQLSLLMRYASFIKCSNMISHIQLEDSVWPF